MTHDLWWQRAACADHPQPELWTDRPPRGWAGKGAQREAIAICSRCPVREQCLAEAMRVELKAVEHRGGIFGGLTPHQRQELHDRRIRGVA